MKRLRVLALLALALTALGLSACTRNVFDDLGQKWQVIKRDSNASYDAFSKYFLNHDPNDPYLD